MKELSEETRRFVEAHRGEDVRALALQAGKYPGVDMPEAVVQIAGWQIARKKIPSWADVPGLFYPKHLSMEQCSSELTARYKASLAEGDSFADLTAGFGVDFSFIARRFRQADYVERQDELCRLAAHNFPLLGLGHVRIHCADALACLERMSPVDCLFLDPARRDGHGGKTVAIADCEPDVCALEPLLVEKGRTVMIKLSPMLDIASALRDLTCVRRIHVIAAGGECKELLLVLRRQPDEAEREAGEAIITCVQLTDDGLSQSLSFTYSEERAADCPMADSVGLYLYEPGASLLKAGAYRLLASRCGVRKLHPNSHLYTSEEKVDFPGRRFRVDAVSGFGKKESKTFLSAVGKANLTVRNFPSSVAELRKKLKLKEGGDVYIFATTLNDGRRVLIKCTKV